MLYLIEILHQTTTAGIAQPATFELYLIEILHQTTTKRSRTRDRSRCILSKFYIKPQRLCRCSSWPSGCILSKFYIKPQRGLRRNEGVVRCILSKFYIKPQHLSIAGGSRNVVSYRNSTSNHNELLRFVVHFVLYLIEILHQTTTSSTDLEKEQKLYLIEILHQTTTSFVLNIFLFRCILSKFYIKPQQRLQDANIENVVSYRNSTSNHNHHDTVEYQFKVVSYRNSTSNHNSHTRHTQ